MSDSSAQHGASTPARASLRIRAAPAYEATTAPETSLFAPEVVPSAVRNRPAAGGRPRRQATSTPSGTTSDQSQGTTNAAALFDPPFPSSSNSSNGPEVRTRTMAGQKRRRPASDAAAPPQHPEDRQKRRRRRCRVRAKDQPAPPNGYPVYPNRPLDPWDWRCARWALTDPGEARMLDMHAAHWREEQAADRARREDERSDDDMGDGGDDDDTDDDDDENGDDHGHGHSHSPGPDHGGEGANESHRDEASSSSTTPSGRRDEGGSGANTRRRRRHGRDDGEGAQEETLSFDDQLRRLVERAQVLLARHQMEALERGWARDRARGVRMQAPGRPRLHHREPTGHPQPVAAAAAAATTAKVQQQPEGVEGESRQPRFRAYIDAEGRPRIHNSPMERHVGRLMRGE